MCREQGEGAGKGRRGDCSTRSVISQSARGVTRLVPDTFPPDSMYFSHHQSQPGSSNSKHHDGPPGPPNGLGAWGRQDHLARLVRRKPGKAGASRRQVHRAEGRDVAPMLLGWEQAAQEVCTSKELDRGWVSVTGWDCLAKARMEAPRAAAHRDRRARCR
jgi:hypothetical protein